MGDKRGISGRQMGYLGGSSLGAGVFIQVKRVSAATATQTIVKNMPFKVRVLDCWAVGRATSAGATVQLARNTTAISSTMAVASSGTLSHATTMDIAQYEVNKGEDLKILVANTPSADVYVLLARV